MARSIDPNEGWWTMQNTLTAAPGIDARLGLAPADSKWNTRVRIGRFVTALPVLFLLFDVTIKLLNIKPVIDSMIRLGYAADFGPAVGALELGCLAVHLVPRTATLGAILLTGFLGGAVATHVRVGDPLFTHVLFPVYVATLLWAGLSLRQTRVRDAIAL